jgi:hypothetical protein
MNQQPLFCEDIYDVLKTIGQACGGSKKIGALLWPDKPIDKAAELWNNCCNSARPEKPDPEQIVFVLQIGRDIGCHVGIDYISRKCKYKWETVEPEDEKAKLRRESIECVKKLEGLVKRLEDLEGK